MYVIIFKGKTTIQSYVFPEFHDSYNLRKVHPFSYVANYGFYNYWSKSFGGKWGVGYSPKKIRGNCANFFPPLHFLTYFLSARN